MKKNIAVALLVLVSTFCQASTNFSKNSYLIYYGDLNYDGMGDYYFHPKENVVLIASDITIPIMVKPESGFYIDGSSAKISEKNLDATAIGRLSEFDGEVLIGDFNNDGHNDLLVKSNNSVIRSY